MTELHPDIYTYNALLRRTSVKKLLIYLIVSYGTSVELCDVALCHDNDNDFNSFNIKCSLKI